MVYTQILIFFINACDKIKPIQTMMKTRRAAIAHHCAIVIQQRFWYARARWNTFKRIQKRLRQIGLEFKVGQPYYELPAHIEMLRLPQARACLRAWLTRIANIARAVPPDDGVVSRVLAAYVFSMYKIHHGPSRSLINSSKRVVTTITAYGSNARRSAVKFMSYLMHLQSAYAAWHPIGSQRVMKAALREATFHVHQVLSNRRGALLVKDTFLPSLFHRVSIMLCTPWEPIESSIMQCAPIKMLQALKENAFWGNGGVSVFSLTHEILMDEHYSLDMEQTFAEFALKHTPPDASTLLEDFKAIVLWPIRQSGAVWSIASIPSEASLVETMNRIFPVMDRLAPEANLGAAWQAIQRSDAVLELLVAAARSFRFHLNLIDEEHCRENITRHAHGFERTHTILLIGEATSIQNTIPWLQRALSKYSDRDLRLVVEGDPYALLGVHDHTIIDFAIDGKLEQAPDTLAYDVQRLAAIRADLAELDRKRVRELVCNGEISTPAIEELRKIVFVSRYQHGECICRLAREIAGHRFELEEFLREAEEFALDDF